MTDPPLAHAFLLGRPGDLAVRTEGSAEKLALSIYSRVPVRELPSLWAQTVFILFAGTQVVVDWRRCEGSAWRPA